MSVPLSAVLAKIDLDDHYLRDLVRRTARAFWLSADLQLWPFFSQFTIVNCLSIGAQTFRTGSID